MKDSEILEIFETFLRDVKHASVNTFNSYLRDIRQLSEYLQSETGLFDASEEDLGDYITSLRDSGKSVATVSRIIASIKCLYQHLVIKQYITHNPSLKLVPDKRQLSLPEIMTDEEVSNLLSQPNPIDAKGYRDKAMLELLYATGIRVTELLDLNIDDVILSDPSILCHSRDKVRRIPIHALAADALKEYLKLVRPQMITSPEEKALFVNLSGERMSRQGFWKIIKYYTQKAGIQKDITPHTLRHSFAVHMIQNGADMETVKEILGHSEKSSTQMYASLVNKDIKEIYEKTHPKA